MKNRGIKFRYRFKINEKVISRLISIKDWYKPIITKQDGYWQIIIVKKL